MRPCQGCVRRPEAFAGRSSAGGPRASLGRSISQRKVEEDPVMNAALPFFLLGLPIVLALYDLVSLRREGTSGRYPWQNLTSNWSREP
jgi:hypothetical protein